MLLADLVAAAAEVSSTRSRAAKTRTLAEVLSLLRPDEVPAAVGVILGRPRQGRLGIGWRTLANLATDPAPTATLRVRDVDEAFSELSTGRGSGSAARRSATLTGLMSRASAEEQNYLVRVMTGEMRTGALEGVLVDAVAHAAELDKNTVRRAVMLSGDLGATARAALEGDDLTLVDLTPGVPVQPMLAGTAPSPGEAVSTTGAASVEYKLDGARLQVHRVGGQVSVYTRSLADITDRVPEVVDVVAAFGGGDLVLDGEMLAVDEAGAARPFQDTMRSLGRDGSRTLAVWFFDILYGAGRSRIEEPLAERRTVLRNVAGDHAIPGRLVAADDPDGAQAVLDEALAAGHEGIVVKALDSPYSAGRRGSHWIKVKPVYTYDLVVLAVEDGSGRRSGQLSNIHLGARDPDGQFGPAGGFVMVGKTFKGLTDDTLRWQTDYFPTIADRREGHVLHVRPETVVEVAVDGVQRSTRYPGGAALRFARVKRYRTGIDAKPAQEADTIASIRNRLPRL
ncbi:ATP-dependent DNA ligase [Gordonia sp. HY002]|uniref:ATP-dependent DNA ligase n=1 Tax=Gordonia zhenghanii TaxID=2911516 RepID=UPI001EEFE842|nr:ATP-dependent DNA ligase [Gordonia zhenghanii]MCF8571750.1 ATP-dependent DNA ligase [Gordonia zhenghanii]MCF8604925.1 ATP-dependent DNA ligase [Gordonia zhenghanii]